MGQFYTVNVIFYDRPINAASTDWLFTRERERERDPL